MTLAKCSAEANWNTIMPHAAYDLPNGVKVIAIYYDGTRGEFKEAPNALLMNGITYGKSSHNSDTKEIIYRTDKQVATIVK